MEDRGFNGGTPAEVKTLGKESEMRRKYMVICEWTDGETGDADELAVFAASPSKAVEMARAIWSTTKGADWPHCRLERVFVLTRGMMRSFA
jgi:hypothetical protein